MRKGNEDVLVLFPWGMGTGGFAWQLVCIVMLVYSFMERGAEKPSREMPMAGDWHASIL